MTFDEFADWLNELRQSVPDDVMHSADVLCGDKIPLSRSTNIMCRIDDLEDQAKGELASGKATVPDCLVVAAQEIKKDIGAERL